MDHRKLAIQATLHCAVGCQIGEFTGITLTTILNLPYSMKFFVSIPLAFIFGYAFTVFPMVRSKMGFKRALLLTFASDTFSITSMEVGDSLSLFLIPGALSSGVFSFIYWIKLTVALVIGILVALPVNYFLIKHGRGHSHMH